MKKIDGIIYAMLSSAAFGFMPIFAKVIYNNGTNTLSLISMRFLLAALFLFIFFLAAKVNFKIDKKQLKILVFISFFGYMPTGLCLFFSYNYIPVGLATTMHFIYPAAVMVLNYFIYKESFDKNKILSLSLSIVGVYILVGFKSHGINILGAFLALLSGFTYSCSIMGMNHPHVKKLDNTVLVFYFSLFSGIGIFIFTLFSRNLKIIINASTVASMIGIALISTIIAILLFVKALKIIGSSSTSILGTFEPIVSIIMGILLFGEKLTTSIVVGTILILLSVVIIAAGSKTSAE